MNKIRKYMILILIIMLIIVFILVGIKIKDWNQEKKLEELGDAGEETEFNTTSLKLVDDKIKFYTVNNCIQQYLDYLNTNNSIYFDRDGESMYSEKEIKEFAYNILSKEFVEKNNITIENISNYIDKLNSRLFFTPIEMKVSVGPTIEKYAVYGIEQSEDNKVVKKVYMMVNLDNSNGTFSIEPLDSSQIKSLDDIKIENQDNEEIEENENNTFKEVQVTYADSIKNYVTAYKRLALGSPEDAYNLFDNEYATKRFETKEKFAEYVQKNREEIEKIQCTKYKAEQSEGYNQYIGIDQYGNYYIVKETDPMKISLSLDNYTILSEKFKDEYNKGSDSHKVMMNIDRWNSMLKVRDYTNAYNLLDDTFRRNNFDTVEKFESYMRENLPSHYELTYSNYSEENDTKTQEVVFKDMDSDEQKTLNIIMKLKEGTDFVMSFSIK